MIDIAKRKLPPVVIGLFVYLSYCAMSWYISRGNLAYYGTQYGFSGWFVNDVWAFFLGGIIPFALYSLFYRFAYRSLALKIGGDCVSLRYGLNFAVIAANIVLFLIKFVYIAVPLYATVINIVIDPIVTVIFVGLYLFYAFKQNYIDKSRYRFVVTQVMGMFIAVYVIIALFGSLWR